MWRVTRPVTSPSFTLGERAGLGSARVNNLLLHPEFGSWIQLHALITDAQVAPDLAPMSDPCISCLSCVSACPRQAITTEDFFADEVRALRGLVQDAALACAGGVSGKLT